MRELDREILLSFWKVHILHHADEGPIHGHWIAQELRRHGYEISPGTLYPLLGRLVTRRWLACVSPRVQRKRARKDYRLTAKGRLVLRELRKQVTELYQEVVLEAEHGAAQHE